MLNSFRKSHSLLALLLCITPLTSKMPSPSGTRPPKKRVKIIQVKDKKRTPILFSNTLLQGKKRIAARKKFKSMGVKPLKEMNEKDLRAIADVALSLGWHEDALRYLERLVVLTNSARTKKELKLEIADLNFDRGALKLSATEYEEYLKLYPGDKHAEYAQYKGLLSNFYSMLSADRDQTATHKTIQLADTFLDKSSTYKHYNEDVKNIRTTCYNRLYEHEVTVFDYYMKKGSTKAAETRLSSIKKAYFKKLPESEPNIMHLEYRLAQAKGMTDEAKKIHYKLASRFPSYSLRMAQADTKKKSYVSFF